MLAQFVSNRDEFRSDDFPNEIACKPDVGEYVESLTGKIFKISAIYFCYANIDKAYLFPFSKVKTGPYIKIELTKSW